MILYYGRGQLNELVGDPNGLLDAVSNINHFIHMAFSVVDHDSVLISFILAKQKGIYK